MIFHFLVLEDVKTVECIINLIECMFCKNLCRIEIKPKQPLQLLPVYSPLYIVHFLLKRHWCWKYQLIIFTTSAAAAAACSLRHLILIKCLWCGVVKTAGCDPLLSIQPFISGRCLAKNSRQKDVGLLASENGLPEVQLFFFFLRGWGGDTALRGKLHVRRLGVL